MTKSTIVSRQRLPLSWLDQPGMIGLYRNWRARRPGAAVPLCHDLQCEALVRDAAQPDLIAVEGEGVYRFWYHAPGMVRVANEDLTGKCTADLRPRVLADLMGAMVREVVQLAGPVLYAVDAHIEAGRLAFRQLMLPASADGARVDRVLVATGLEAHPFWPMRRALPAQAGR